MRVFYWPERSPVGVSVGWLGMLLAAFYWLLLFAVCLLLVWPFQVIWRGLPQAFPNANRDSLRLVQIVLTLVWIAFVVVATVLGGHQTTDSGGASS
jgi:O-antigen/teichoic acid export membrane protein